MGQENIERLWTLLSAISKDARNAAKKKCKEKEYDITKGIVGLDESLNNLSHVGDVLKAAIESKKLIQFPYSFQVDLEKKLAAVAKLLNDLSEGTDTIEPLVIEIDQLYYLIWQSRLENVSAEFLGYQEKVNKIKALELELEKLKTEMESGLALKTELQLLKDSIAQNEASSVKALEEIKENSKKAVEGAASVLAAQQESSAKLTITGTTVSALEKALQNCKANELTIASLTENIQDFHVSIDENKKKIAEVRVAAEAVVTNTNTEVKALTEKLTKDAGALAVKTTANAEEATMALKSQSEKILTETEARNIKILSDLEKRESEIKDQMAKVTGLGLFGAFRKRMEDIVASKNKWVNGVFLMLALIALLTAIIAWTFTSIDGAFYLKLSIYLPLLVGIIFCATNYGHERQLEEEYAFKSSISLSLVPYKDLVEESTEDKEKYADFLIKAVDNVFASPTDKVFSGSREDGAAKIDKSIDKYILRAKNLVEISREVNPVSNILPKK